MTLPTFPRDAYIDPPSELRALRNLTPAQHGWGRGWPDDCPKAAQLATPKVPRPSDGRDFGRPVRKELAPLFERLFRYAMELAPGWELRSAAETHGGQGGTVCRAIKGSEPPVASDHSRGKAWDVNSRGNAMRVGKNGAAVNFISRQPPVLIELAAAALMYWGGWYWDARHRDTGHRYYVDSMHFEFVGRVSDVPRALAALDAKYAALKPPPEEPEVNPEQVKAVQTAYNATLDAIGSNARRLVVDGDYGPVTTAAIAGLPDTVREANAALKEQLNALAANVAKAVPLIATSEDRQRAARELLGG